MIQDMLKPDTDLPEWVQSKITLATDYIVTAADYLHSEMKEEFNESFADTMTHKNMANAAKESGDTHAFHGHMVDHHVSMANFHKEHGDDKSAKEHEEKAKEHHSNMERYYREDVEHIAEKISVVQGQAPRQQGRFAPNNQIRTVNTSIGRVVSGTQYTGTRKPKPSVKEEVVQEGRPSQKKNDDSIPFDGPYKKSPSVITDKSGAKHGPMSRARDLARAAAKKQAGSMKEEKQKSRKAQIIKDASKGKDKFEKDPIITDTTTKTDNLQ
jgi:hypothetical protein